MKVFLIIFFVIFNLDFIIWNLSISLHKWINTGDRFKFIWHWIWLFHILLNPVASCSWMGLFIGWFNPMIVFVLLLHLMWWKRDYLRFHCHMIWPLHWNRNLTCICLESSKYYLRVMGGCLCLCCLGDSTAMLEIWMLKEYKVQSSWHSHLFNLSCNCHSDPYFFFPIYALLKMTKFWDLQNIG